MLKFYIIYILAFTVLLGLSFQFISPTLNRYNHFQFLYIDKSYASSHVFRHSLYTKPNKSFHSSAMYHSMAGLGDLLKKAFENENLPPPKNPGLNRELDPVIIQFLPANKIIKAIPGQKLSLVAQSSGIEIKYSCKKGNCGTCSVKFNGNIVKACQTSIPIPIPLTSSESNKNSKIIIEILPPQKGVGKNKI